ELGGDKVPPAGLRIRLTDFVNGEDVWMIERGCGASFLLEAADSFPILSETRQQQLERHWTVELRVARQVNHSHPARSDPALDAVAPNRLPGLQHRLLGRLPIAPTASVQCGLPHKIAQLVICLQQRGHFTPQLRVIRASRIEKGDAFAGRAFARGVKERFQLLLAFCDHYPARNTFRYCLLSSRRI